MAIWKVEMVRDVTRVGRVTVEAGSEQAARLATYEFLENGKGDDDHWITHDGDCDMSSSPADQRERPEIRATDADGNYERVDEDER